MNAELDLSPAPAAPDSSGALVSMIERLAVDPRVDVDKLDRLLQMQERVMDRNARAAFDAAVSIAKGEIGPIHKNKTVDFTSQKGRTNYRHEDFAEVARTVDPVLKRHGLSYRFRAAQSGPKLSVTCVLSHRDGFSEETTLEAENDNSGNKNSIQAVGSSATYLQRYTLKLALGLAASADDDAKSASGPQEIGPIDADQIAHLEQLIQDTGSDRGQFLKACKVDAIENLSLDHYKAALTRFAAKKKAMAK